MQMPSYLCKIAYARLPIIGAPTWRVGLAGFEFLHFCLGFFYVGLNAGRLVGVVGLLLGSDQELLHLGDFLAQDFDAFFSFFIHEN